MSTLFVGVSPSLDNRLPFADVLESTFLCIARFHHASFLFPLFKWKASGFCRTLLDFPAEHLYNHSMLAFQLYQLQQVDSTRDDLSKRVAALEARLADHHAVESAEATARAASERLQRARHALRQAEAEAEAVRMKIRRSEEMLYSGSVRNPKELQDLQKEVGALKRLLSRREDAQLEAMVAAEEAEAAQRAAEGRLQAVRHERLQQETRWRGELDDLQQRLASLDGRRAALAAEVPPDALTTYERLRQSRGGLAIAAVEDHACTACGAPLTPDLVRAARSGDALVFCRTCKRILYVP